MVVPPNRLLSICTLGAVGLWITVLDGTTYYVDFQAGDNEADGLSPSTPFRHAPGDPAAFGGPAEVDLQAGDRVRFKGGVRYRGTIRFSGSGQLGQPVIFDGNGNGDFGEGLAIIDGSSPLIEWIPCQNPGDALGNPHWESIYYIDIDAPDSWRSLNLTGPDGPLPVAMRPKPSDSLFQEDVSEYYHVQNKLESLLPVQIYREPGTHVNADRPLTHVLSDEAGSTVISPIGSAAFTVALKEPTEVTALGIVIQSNYTPIKTVEFLADGERVKLGTLPEATGEMHRFELDQPITATTFTFRLLEAHGEPQQNWTAVRRVAAWHSDGENLLTAGDGMMGMTLVDPAVFTAVEPDYYMGMSLAVHAGNNNVFYLPITEYDPAAHRIITEHFSNTVYDSTRYALFNSPRLIERPGEYAVQFLGNGKARVFMMAANDGHPPEDITYGVQSQGFDLNEAHHVVLDGFTIERQSGSAVRVRASGSIWLRDSEIAYVRGGPAISVSHSNRVVVKNVNIHNLPGHTKGIVYHTCTDSDVLDSRIHRPTSTALDYYGCTGGRVAGNTVTGFYGMHANGLTFYLGCQGTLIERNWVYDGNICLTIQDAEDIMIRNNVFDAGGRGVAVGIWTSVPFRNVRFLHNAILNGDPSRNWTTGMFSNNLGPEGLVVKNNIIDGLAGNLPGTYQHNLYTRLGPDQKAGELGIGELYVESLEEVLEVTAGGIYRLRADSPALGAGTPAGVTDDFAGRLRTDPENPDIGPFQWNVDGVPPEVSSAPHVDADGDGVKNAIEWVVGGTSNTMDSDKLPILAVVTVDPAGDFTEKDYLLFTYRRTAAASANQATAISVRYGSDLSEPENWTNASHGVDGVVVVEKPDAIESGVDEVLVYIPLSAAQPRGLFVRLEVILTEP